MKPLKTPDLTPAQIIAFVFGAAPYVAVLLGLDLNAEQTDALENIKYLALGLFGADAVVRFGRNLGQRQQQVNVQVDEQSPASEAWESYDGSFDEFDEELAAAEADKP